MDTVVASINTLNTRLYAHGITVGRSGDNGFSLHPSGDDEVWDAWCEALDDMFPEAGRQLDGPEIHRDMPGWYLTRISAS